MTAYLQNLTKPYGVPSSKRSPFSQRKTLSSSSREAPKSSGRYKKNIRRLSKKLNLRIFLYFHTKGLTLDTKGILLKRKVGSKKNGYTFAHKTICTRKNRYKNVLLGKDFDLRLTALLHERYEKPR